MIGTIVSAVGGLVGTWLGGKQKITEAKIERETKALTNEADWDRVQADASKQSWKDEWLTILVSIPLIMSFVPGLDVYVKAGFEVLEQMPDWYQYTIGLVFAASFGVKKAVDVIGTLKR